LLTNKRIAAGISALSVMALAAACGGSSGGGSSASKINLVAYSTPQKVYAKLIPDFQKTTQGLGSSFTQSYDSSGSQSRAVIAGLPADVVEFSRQPDMDKLVDANLVPSTWNANQYKGFVTDSVVVLVVRKGNPKHITGWDDLTKPGIQVVTPDPRSSGSACWNLMAAYGAQLKEGKTPDQALAYIKALLENTVSQPSSGSKATAAFVGGQGDVLISYENEAIAAEQAGEDVQFITPPDTILIQNPIAVTTSAKDSTLANNFVKYLYTVPAQKIFASQGYRPVVKAAFDAKQFPTPTGLFTIGYVGGWDKVDDEFFDADNGSITKIENDLGTSG
jgi:sulfate/thiosulfate transport system substrate-binding protein